MSRFVFRLTTSVSSFVLLFLVSSLSADHRTPKLYPPGLERGDQYRLFFTTSESRDATFSNINIYNEFVQSVADAAPVVGSWDIEWNAVISTRRVDARDNTGTNDDVDPVGAPIYLLDGSLYARTNFDLWNEEANLNVTIGLTELGTILPIVPDGPNGEDGVIQVWTGSNENGVAFAPAGQGLVSIGAASTTGAAQFSFTSLPPIVDRPLYAMSEVLTVPEPGFGWCLWPALLIVLLKSRQSVA